MSETQQPQARDRQFFIEFPRHRELLMGVGSAFVLISLLSILMIIVMMSFRFFRSFSLAGEASQSSLISVGDYLILFAIGIICALIGLGLIKLAGRSPFSSIPPGDQELIEKAIKEGDDWAITQYIRVRALSGFTGGFTKIGLTGLPLTMVVITGVFTMLAVATHGQEDMPKTFFDLVKLTLGAFIGSYVQRQVDYRADRNSRSPRRPP